MKDICFTNPCAGCPVSNLSHNRLDVAYTVDTVLEEHGSDEIAGASDTDLYGWTASAALGQFQEGFVVNEPVEFDVVVSAARKIVNNDCPSRQ